MLLTLWHATQRLNTANTTAPTERGLHLPPSQPSLLMIGMNVLRPSSSRSSKRFPHQHSVYIRLPILAICPAHPSLLHFTILTILGDLYRSRRSALQNIEERKQNVVTSLNDVSIRCIHRLHSFKAVT